MRSINKIFPYKPFLSLVNLGFEENICYFYDRYYKIYFLFDAVRIAISNVAIARRMIIYVYTKLRVGVVTTALGC